VDLPSFYLGPPDQAEDAPSFFFAWRRRKIHLRNLLIVQGF
jgi:hypothetical protein